MGTPLPDNLRKPNGEPYLSGTEWEYEDAVNSPQQPPPAGARLPADGEAEGRAATIPISTDKAAQFERVEAFFAQFRNADGSLKGGVNEYATPSDFKALLRQHLEEMLYRRLQPSADDVEPAPTAAEIPAEYYDWLRRSLEKIELLGAKEGRAVTLNHVYVPALTRPAPAPEAQKRGRKKQREEAEEQKPIPLLQRLDQESLYVSAPAGAGKSTFCRWAVLQSIAGTELTHPVPAPEDFAEPVPTALRGRLPLLVPLREFWRSMDCGRGATNLAPRRSGAGARRLGGRLAADGSDRRAAARPTSTPAAPSCCSTASTRCRSPHRRNGVTTYPRELLLSGLADALPAWRKAGNRMLLTSRPYGLDEAGLHRLGLPSAPLEPLPQPLQDLFVARWFHTLGKAEQTPGLIETIRDRDDLAPLVENPMLLTALCVLYDSGGRLPEDRYELYKSIVDNVLHNRYPGDARERDPVERRLEAIALGMHTGECAGAPRLTPAAEISWVETERLLARFAELNPVLRKRSGRSRRRGARICLTHSGLLVPRPNDRAAFYHLSFQEFLAAAAHLARTPDDVEQSFPRARRRAGVAADAAVSVRRPDRHAGTPQWGLGLLGRLIKDQDRTAVKANPAPAVFIAEALDLCLAKKYAVPEELKEDFRRLALDAIEDEVELQARQALGLCLGRLGDPRILDLRDPAAYVEVPAGTYPYGDEGKTVEIATPFRIGRYPVTNGQYAGFHRRRRLPRPAVVVGRRLDLAAGGEGHRARVLARPALERSEPAGGGCQLLGGRGVLRLGRRPAADANRSGRPPPAVRTGFAYPWGNDWEDGICNTGEAGLGVTSPVGLFPRARQADLGIEDLAGNVWEWCGSLYDPSDTRTRMRPVCCAAGPGTTIRTTRARPTAAGTTRTPEQQHRLSCGVFVAHQRTLSTEGRRVSAALRFSAVLGGADDQRLQDVPAQAPAVGVTNVVDPALDAGIELGEADLAGVIGRQPRPQPPVRRAHLARLDQAVGGKDNEAEPGNPGVHRQHLRPGLVDDEAQAARAAR